MDTNEKNTYWVRIQYTSDKFCWLKVDASLPSEAWDIASHYINGIVTGVYLNGELVS